MHRLPTPPLHPYPLSTTLFPFCRSKYDFLWCVSCGLHIGYRDLGFGFKSPYSTYFFISSVEVKGATPQPTLNDLCLLERLNSAKGLKIYIYMNTK